jgi:hypothetical protein
MINGSHRYITEDNGNSFIEITNEVPTGFNSFSAVTDKMGYAVGNLGLVLRYDDTTYIPVELVSFTGKTENNTVVLEWITASELNNYGFEIQRLIDNNQWERVGFVLGKGTSIETNYYRFSEPIPYNKETSYRLKQIDYDGSFKYSDIIEVKISLNNFELFQNYPNPFNPTTTIKYDLPVSGNVELVVYDILGRKVVSLINETKDAGRYEAFWNASNVASGIYIYQLKSNEFVSSKKMILLK